VTVRVVANDRQVRLQLRNDVNVEASQPGNPLGVGNVFVRGLNETPEGRDADESKYRQQQ
jgi:hypothetical protein